MLSVAFAFQSRAAWKHTEQVTLQKLDRCKFFIGIQLTTKNFILFNTASAVQESLGLLLKCQANLAFIITSTSQNQDITAWEEVTFEKGKTCTDIVKTFSFSLLWTVASKCCSNVKREYDPQNIESFFALLTVWLCLCLCGSPGSSPGEQDAEASEFHGGSVFGNGHRHLPLHQPRYYWIYVLWWAHRG